ncbi:M23 family metallopeptidase [Ancylobacter terrae]|uniref:M23 family metallopeptidase n=1 Tax=Ancylobacter sp. sgz301288 TaxID=3342077 RepID=UPI00385BA478
MEILNVPALARRLLAAGVVAGSFVVTLTGTLPAGADERPFTALAVSHLADPRPVAGADGRTHLVYELSLVNMTRLVVRVDAIEATDGPGGKPLGRLDGDGLAAVFRINGGDPGVVLGPSQSALVFMDVALPAGAPVPAALGHRIATTRMKKAAGTDIHKGLPLGPSDGIPAEVTFETAPVGVDARPAIRLSPPLRGPGWLAANGCCDTITSHRGGVMAFDGTPYAPERFAIDFVQIDRDHRLATGPIDQLASYPYFGVPIHAAADGVVVGLSDGAPERTPGELPTDTTIANATGNHIVVDMGAGNFALYAHLKTGTVAVKIGDRVRRGDVIAQLGNTGNTDGPHLHFHVMDGPSPLSSNGLPYVFDAFTGQGRLQPDDAFFAGKPGALEPGWLAGPHANQLPLNNEVVDFGP